MGLTGWALGEKGTHMIPVWTSGEMVWVLWSSYLSFSLLFCSVFLCLVFCVLCMFMLSVYLRRCMHVVKMFCLIFYKLSIVIICTNIKEPTSIPSHYYIIRGFFCFCLSVPPRDVGTM